MTLTSFSRLRGAVLGGVLRWDRERKNLPAGLRTHTWL
jgi:uncharacterized membrane protein YhiD involved in acid resistance